MHLEGRLVDSPIDKIIFRLEECPDHAELIGDKCSLADPFCKFELQEPLYSCFKIQKTRRSAVHHIPPILVGLHEPAFVGPRGNDNYKDFSESLPGKLLNIRPAIKDRWSLYSG